MSSLTCIAKEEKSMPEYAAEENRLILLLMANAEDHCKLKRLFVLLSANSRALKDLVKGKFSVIKRQNYKAGVKVCLDVSLLFDIRLHMLISSGLSGNVAKGHEVQPTKFTRTVLKKRIKNALFLNRL